MIYICFHLHRPIWSTLSRKRQFFIVAFSGSGRRPYRDVAGTPRSWVHHYARCWKNTQELPIQQILPSVLEHCKSSADLVLQVPDKTWKIGPTVVRKSIFCFCEMTWQWHEATFSCFFVLLTQVRYICDGTSLFQSFPARQNARHPLELERPPLSL